MSPEFPESSPHKVNWLKQVPIAHRGLHDCSQGVFENTLSAAKRAVEHGYAIEMDLQFSADGVPMVFHDYTLERLCGVSRNVRDAGSAELKALRVGASADPIPTLKELLVTVAGKVPVVLELKGQYGADEGFIEAVGVALQGYGGNVAIMSFSHHLIRDARRLTPHLSLGLTAEGNEGTYESHAEIDRQTQVDFLSYGQDHLDCQFVKEFAQSGRPVICWTIRNTTEAAKCLQFADQITFEGFLP